MSISMHARVVVAEVYRIVLEELRWVPLLAAAAIKKLRGD